MNPGEKIAESPKISRYDPIVMMRKFISFKNNNLSSRIPSGNVYFYFEKPAEKFLP